MNDWRELKTLQEVAEAQKNGDEIEVDTGPSWETWKGTAWMDYIRYRARPRQPKMKQVKMLCWLCGNELHWLNAAIPSLPHWTRVPNLDYTIEIPE